jgi:uncharacterized protein YdaU (DUF1376 family)
MGSVKRLLANASWLDNAIAMPKKPSQFISTPLQSFSGAQTHWGCLDLDQNIDAGRALRRAAQSAFERTHMSDPRFDIPPELRNLSQRSIEQTEKAFNMSFEAANKSMAALTYPGAEVSKMALSLAEQT